MKKRKGEGGKYPPQSKQAELKTKVGLLEGGRVDVSQGTRGAACRCANLRKL